MSKKIKIINNIKSIVSFNINPVDGFRTLPRQGAFMNITEDELNYIYINQQIIQKGILWVDDKDMRVQLGLETEDGTKDNKNIIQHEDIVKLIEGHHKTLERNLKSITEPTILLQFVEIARELNIDSVAKIKMIEESAKVKIFEDE